MNIIPLFFQCGCAIRLTEKRELDSLSLCERHHSELRLAEKANKFLQEPLWQEKKK